MQTRTIVQSRRKIAIFLVIALLFVAADVLSVIYRPNGRITWMDWGGIVFFGLCALAFGWSIVRPQYVRVDEEGFSLGGGLRSTPRRFRWSDIDHFFVQQGPRGVPLIAFSYRPGSEPHTAMVAAARAIGAPVGALPPSGWPMPPDELVDLMNDYRAQGFGSTPQASAPEN